MESSPRQLYSTDVIPFSSFSKKMENGCSYSILKFSIVSENKDNCSYTD